MTKCNITELTARGVIKVSGGDAKKFLQDIVTNDVNKAVDGRAIHAGMLTPQGKILFDFFLLDMGTHFLLECARENVADLIKRLTFYKLRAAVDFEDLSGTHKVWAAWNGVPDTQSEAIAYPDPRLEILGLRIIAPASLDMTAGCDVASEGDYHRLRIALGVPEADKDYALGDTFPHEADYDLLAGVDFHKGCYVGQEVVSRMQHRGTARKRIVPARGNAPLTQGAKITAGDAAIGMLGSVAGDMGLAMVRLDRVQKAVDEGYPLMAGDVEINLTQPGWANFDLPTQGDEK
ncbi:MAG: CAF17-like 4Fe-4S cluster assembly/insertion protein YgfZ [Alphaproteobacteria bacterium]